MSTHTVRIEDKRLNKVLDTADSKSDTMREALRLLAREKGKGVFTDLTEDQAVAYRWLLDNVGTGGLINGEIAEVELAQVLGKNQQIIRRLVLTPLDAGDYIDVITGVRTVNIRVHALEVHDDDA